MAKHTSPIELQAVSYEQKPVLRQLLELYQHETSAYDGDDVDAHGRYGYRYLDHYWAEPGRHAFFVRVNGQLAGFIMVRTLQDAAGDDEDSLPLYSMAEFFIMRKYQGAGVGRQAAEEIFKRFPGRWRVGETPGNKPALAFWRKVIGEFTGGAYEETYQDDARWQGPVQSFVTPPTRTV